MEFVKLQTDVQNGTISDQTRYRNVIYALPMIMDGTGIVNLGTTY